MIPLGAHFALKILDNQQTSNIASIDHYSLFMLHFSAEADFLGKSDVIDTH